MVDRVHRSGKPFTEILAQSQVERGVPRQVVSGIRLAGKSIACGGAAVAASAGGTNVPARANNNRSLAVKRRMLVG
jgi:hypothetical protein